MAKKFADKIKKIYSEQQRLKKEEFINLIRKNAELNAHCGICGLYFRTEVISDVVHDVIDVLTEDGFTVTHRDNTLIVMWSR